MNSIYILKCPITNFVKYVGITNNPLRRMYEHKRLETNKHKYNWFQSLRKKGLSPKIEILEGDLTRDVAAKKEILYIRLFKDLGYKLVNITTGGECPPSRYGKVLSEKTKQKMIKNSSRKKTVYQYSKDGLLIGFFVSARDAFRKTGVDHRSISEVANGSNPKRHSAGGFKWHYNIK